MCQILVGNLLICTFNCRISTYMRILAKCDLPMSAIQFYLHV